MIGMPYVGTFAVSQRYGSNKAAYARWNMEGHNGCDFALPWGTLLLACVSGVVTERQNDPTGYGEYTVITDDAGGQWLYGHGSSWLVTEGQRVALGQQLGRSGNTGNSTGPHLHFGYRPFGYDRNNGYLGYVNPRPFLPIPYRVLLQAGHVGASPASGAPREAEWTEKFTLALRLKLQATGIQTSICGDFYHKTPPPVVSEDFDLFLACHYDARWPDTYTSGCCIARGDFETEPWEADRFITEWKRLYPAATGIPLHQERVNPNMTRYYALASLTYVTPGIVVEHGVGAPGVGLDAPVLWEDLERVAGADASAVLAYLLVTPQEEDMSLVDELNRQVADLRAEIDGLHGITTELQSQVAALHEEVATRTAERDALQGLTNTYEPRLREMEAALRQAVTLATRHPERVEVVLDGERLGYIPEAA